MKRRADRLDALSPVGTGSWVGPPREERAPRVGISSTVFGVRGLKALILTHTPGHQDVATNNLGNGNVLTGVKSLLVVDLALSYPLVMTAVSPHPLLKK